ncbi:MAG: anion permease [Endomicrobiia bacterium]
MPILVILVVLLSLIFSFSNGYNNSANIIAIPVGTRALLPTKALILASIFEFIGTYFLGKEVAKTIAVGIIEPNIFFGNSYAIIILFSTLLTSIFWNIICTFLGIPVSASHALIGGFVGSSIAAFGYNVVKWNNVLKIFSMLIIAPILSFILSYLVTKISYFLSRNATLKINNLYKNLQIISSLGCALAHGSNDGQRNVGILTFGLIVLGIISPTKDGNLFVPRWIVFLSALSISLGIMFGGLSVIKTVGMNIYKIKHINGFSAQFTSTVVVYIASLLGIPLSTTHVVTTSVMGTGVAERIKAVKWLVSRDIFLTWILTIPLSLIISYFLYFIILEVVKILNL